MAKSSCDLLMAKRFSKEMEAAATACWLELHKTFLQDHAKGLEKGELPFVTSEKFITRLALLPFAKSSTLSKWTACIQS